MTTTATLLLRKLPPMIISLIRAGHIEKAILLSNLSVMDKVLLRKLIREGKV